MTRTGEILACRSGYRIVSQRDHRDREYSAANFGTSLERGNMRIKRSFETTNENRKDDSSSFDVQLAYWRSVHTSMVGYGATPTPVSADVMLAKNVTGSLPITRSWLVPSAVDTASHQGPTNCRVRHVYSQHDIVGDPLACIMGALTIGGSSTAVAP